MTDSLHIAVLGDLHGRLRLALQLCRHWQVANGRMLDGVLICGDLGFFPDPSRIDRATQRHADHDPEELGFSMYFRAPEPPTRDAIVEEAFQSSGGLKTLQAPIYWCHGNHEDFAAIDEALGSSACAPVDAYGRFLLVRSGAVVQIESLRIASVGGAPEQHTKRQHRNPQKFVNARATNRLAGEDFDILLCHGAPQGLGGESDHWGSQLTRDLIDLTDPAYCFFAHHGSPVPDGAIGRCQCRWLNDVAFERAGAGPFGPVESGCMGILRWASSQDHSFARVDDDWFRAINGRNWRQATEKLVA